VPFLLQGGVAAVIRRYQSFRLLAATVSVLLIGLVIVSAIVYWHAGREQQALQSIAVGASENSVIARLGPPIETREGGKGTGRGDPAPSSGVNPGRYRIKYHRVLIYSRGFIIAYYFVDRNAKVEAVVFEDVD